MMTPDQLRFAKTHEWVSVNGDIATVGISDFAVKELTDVVHIELPRAGSAVKAGDAIGEIESVKAVSDLYAPVAGEVVEVNDSLTSDLGSLSDDPFGRGWIVKIRMQDAGQVNRLLDYPSYEQHCQSH